MEDFTQTDLSYIDLTTLSLFSSFLTCEIIPFIDSTQLSLV